MGTSSPDTSRTWLIETPIRIVTYLVVALLVREVAHRVIDRATRRPIRAVATPPHGPDAHNAPRQSDRFSSRVSRLFCSSGSSCPC